MWRFVVVILVCLVAGPSLCRGQVGGNVVYGQGGGKVRALQNERGKRLLPKDDQPRSGTSMFVEAGVLMNVPADEYVAVFGIVQEGETVAECGRKTEAAIKQFGDELKTLGVADEARFVDFVAQNKVYDYEINGDVAREKLVGFELKKNVSIHYKDKSLLEKLVVAASHAQVFDLIKVDYIVLQTERIQERLMEEAGRVVKRKASRYEKLLDVKLVPTQVYAEKPATYFPTAMYDSFSAFEAEQIGSAPRRDRLTTQTARKSRTFFYNGLDADGFDAVVNPVLLEPVVQFTLYLKVKYEVKPPKAS